MTPRKEACRACEDAAKVCDQLAAPHDEDARMRPFSNGYYSAATTCATSIRSSCRHDDRDAERWRWLRDASDPDREQPCVMLHKQDSWGNWRWHVVEQHVMDAAIDALLAASPPAEGTPRDNEALRLHDDGNSFMCMRCGKVEPRTRSNPYPNHVCDAASGEAG